jgi:uncharacterized cupredoxin-like copper-binding protein
MRFPLDHVKFWCCCLMMIMGLCSFPTSSVLAERFSTGAAASTIVTAPTEIKISLGNTANELKFFPDRVQLVAGQKYKLLLSNSSPQKHYFTAMEFASIKNS